MKLRPLTSLAILAALLAALPAGAHGGHEHRSKGEEVRHHDLRGTLAAIHLAQKTFELRLKNKTVICYFDEKTRVTRDGKDISFAELKPGDAVTCRCSAEKEGRHYSQRLWLRLRSPAGSLQTL